jgi:isocitrate dehydrogenase
MLRIKMKNPIVEMDGDEMTRVMWKMVKDKLISPHVDLNVDYYDLGLAKRDETDDQITIAAAEATKKHKVAVKCATITPDAGRVNEYKLKKQWKSPNGTIRSALDGTVFRCPIMAKNIRPAVRNWTKPIVIGRHAFGDVYRDTEMRVPAAGRVELFYTPAEGTQVQRMVINEFQGPGIVMGMFNVDDSITSFARACFTYAIDHKIDVIFSCKDTISKTYHAQFRIIFRDVFEKEFKARFDELCLKYTFTLIDDAVARIMKSEGGMLWALRNYDGDVMSDMVASAFGSLAMMTSDLISPHGYFEYEAAHGTVQRHYYQHQKGERTSTNSMALIYAWTGALSKRGRLDGNAELCDFAERLEEAAIATIESGVMTKDLVSFADPKPERFAYTDEFIEAVSRKLEELLQPGAPRRPREAKDCLAE